MTPDWNRSQQEVTGMEQDTDIASSESGSYEPQYVGIADIPIAGPGADTCTSGKNDFSDTQKRKALFFAESKLELDLNDGHPIREGNVSKHHKNAVMQLATFLLIGAAEDPDSTSVSDMVDGGSISENAQQYLDMYKEVRFGIRESEEDAGGNDNHTVTVNGRSSPSRKGNRRRNINKYFR